MLHETIYIYTFFVWSHVYVESNSDVTGFKNVGNLKMLDLKM